MTIEFASKCWGQDFYQFISGAFERKLDSLNYPFDKKTLYINNNVPEEVKFSCDTVKVMEEQAETLDFFELTDEDFKRNGHSGYVYSIAELTAIRMATCDYLVYLQGDSLLTLNNDFVIHAIEVLETNKTISVVSPYSEVNTYGDVDWECSDQCFVIRVKEFQKKIYNEDEPEQDNYPKYAGRSFEYMVGQMLKRTGQGRLILFDSYISHPVY